MIVLLVFAFLSGLATILAPCIWPLLPIVLSATTTGGKGKPLGITVGIVLSFSVVTLALSYLVKILPLDPDVLRFVAAFIITVLGFVLIIPQLTAHFEAAVSRLVGTVGQRFTKRSDNDWWSGFVTGLACGVIWAPCAGPILATIATLAATRSGCWGVTILTLFYAAGVGVPLFALTVLGQKLFQRSKFMNRYLRRIQQVFGAVMIATAVMIVTNYDKVLQVKLLDAFPSYTTWLVDLESTPVVQDQLDELRGVNDAVDVTTTGYAAPDIIGIANWLNSEPLTLDELRGKVVLIDFWTYTCINCIRTLPHVQGWYEQYQDDGLVVIGVHSPEFEFEKDTGNVQNAIDMYGLTYPVAQDNDFATWKNYNNRYWPAKYLIDAKGNIRYTHFGEGEYDKTENAIRALLAEAGATVTNDMQDLPDETPVYATTPETYLGLGRIDRFASNEPIQYGVGDYSLPDVLPLHGVAFNGSWDVESQYAEANVGAQLRLHFKAADVFLVIKPAGEGDTITVNDEIITLDTERLYQLYSSTTVVDDELTITFNDPSTQVFAFTFGS